MAKKRERPYWLDGGTETCEFCSHPHVLQTQRRCAWCDRPSCVQCLEVDPATGEFLCEECREGEEEG